MLNVEPIPAFDDNYIWLLREADRVGVAVVDPGDADPVIARLRDQGLELAAILITHHHQDHIGGVADLLARWPDALVTAPKDRRIAAATRVVGEGDSVSIPGFETRFDVIEVPGHTSTHIAYLGEWRALLRRYAVCGRLRPGVRRHLRTIGRIAAADQRAAAANALLLCARIHARQPGLCRLGRADSAALAERTEQARRLRDAGEPTVPSRLALELATNPFLRTAEPDVISAAEGFAGQRLADQTAVFTALRRWKDQRYD